MFEYSFVSCFAYVGLSDALQAPGVEVSEEGLERLYHGHGHTCAEIFALRHGQLERLPDVVLFPKCHEVSICSVFSCYSLCLTVSTSILHRLATFCWPPLFQPHIVLNGEAQGPGRVSCV